jgi:transposase
MLVKTILNRVQKFKSFVYKSVRWVESTESPELEVEVVERTNGRAICSECGCQRPGYDRLPPRRFEFVPLWGIKVFLIYAPRRVDCPVCGVRVEQMPWALGKRRLTQTYGWFLATWAKRLSWKETAEVFSLVWHGT